MGTTGAQRLRRSGLSSKRTRQSIKTIEAQLGQSIGSNTSDNQAGQKTSSERKLGKDNEGSVDKAD